jgi:hypothetical protein
MPICDFSAEIKGVIIKLPNSILLNYTKISKLFGLKGLQFRAMAKPIAK